jgi:hypothetical protein
MGFGRHRQRQSRLVTRGHDKDDDEVRKVQGWQGDDAVETDDGG